MSTLIYFICCSGNNCYDLLIAQSIRFLAYCQWTRIYYSWRPNLQDEGDNHLVELAVAGNARYVLTYNLKDFKGMELKFPDLRFCSPRQFLEENLS